MVCSQTQLNHGGVFNDYAMETTTCFGLYWPSSGCLGNLRVSYMDARARGAEISTYIVVSIAYSLNTPQ